MIAKVRKTLWSGFWEWRVSKEPWRDYKEKELLGRNQERIFLRCAISSKKTKKKLFKHCKEMQKTEMWIIDQVRKKRGNLYHKLEVSHVHWLVDVMN